MNLDNACFILVIISAHYKSLGDYITAYKQGSSLPGSDWSRRMYLETTAFDFEQCQLMCYFHHTQKCTIFAFAAPNCYLGEPLGDYSIVSASATVHVYGLYSENKNFKELD